MSYGLKIKARSQSGSIHILIGKLTDGIPNKKPGVFTPFENIMDAFQHLKRNGWTIECDPLSDPNSFKGPM